MMDDSLAGYSALITSRTWASWCPAREHFNQADAPSHETTTS
jgi:hypothetical protein